MKVSILQTLICVALGAFAVSCAQAPQYQKASETSPSSVDSSNVGVGNIPAANPGAPAPSPSPGKSGDDGDEGKNPSMPAPAPMTESGKEPSSPSQPSTPTASVATARVPDLSLYSYSDNDKKAIQAESERARRDGNLPDIDKNKVSKSISSASPSAKVTKGTVKSTSFASKNSTQYPGKKNADLNSDQQWSWGISVYLPAGFKEGEELPFMIVGDGGWNQHKALMIPTLDNLIAQKRIPRMAAIFINAGPGDSSGSQRGYEYDKVDERYHKFLETEIYPHIEAEFKIKLTKDPKGRGSMGGSSSANMAFTLAWFHPELYYRVVSYSGTFTNRRPSEGHPDGAWEYHSKMIPGTAAKPIRVALHVSQNDLNIGDKNSWPQANLNMAKVLADKGYKYRYFKALNAGHIDESIYNATLAETLEWVWLDYPIP